MENKKHYPGVPFAELNNLQQDMSGNPFPLGVYPVFDDDLPRDSTFDNFAAADLRNLHPYPWGLD